MFERLLCKLGYHKLEFVASVNAEDKAKLEALQMEMYKILPQNSHLYHIILRASDHRNNDASYRPFYLAKIIYQKWSNLKVAYSDAVCMREYCNHIYRPYEKVLSDYQEDITHFRELVSQLHRMYDADDVSEKLRKITPIEKYRKIKEGRWRKCDVQGGTLSFPTESEGALSISQQGQGQLSMPRQDYKQCSGRVEQRVIEDKK